MSEKDLWYGYLNAGTKSTPVLLDPGLSTGNSKTVYLFNLERQRILEYSREIVDAKLRTLRPEEQSLVASLQSGYAQARVGFSPRGGRSFGVPERGPVARRRREETIAEAEEYDEDTEEIAALEWASTDD